MSTDSVKRYGERNGDTVRADTMPVNSLVRSADLGEDLLPGIPNDITLDLITPKFTWKDLQILFSVSYGWQKAIQSHLVYDARVRARSTETVVAVVLQKRGKADSDLVLTIALYSMRDRSWEELPPIPHVRTGIPASCECVSLKGKIYVLGGGNELRYDYGSSKVYVLDLTGQRRWKRCPNMQQPRLRFGSGVKDGKIFVFGGVSQGKPVRGCEVYDPTVRAWCGIKPMKSLRYDSEVSNHGEEFLMHGGRIFVEFGESSTLVDHTKGLFSFEIYDPTKDEWNSKSIEPFGRGSVFTAKGHVHLMTQLGIFLQNIDMNSSTLLQSHSFAEFGLRDSDKFVCNPWAVEDELLAVVGWFRGRLPDRICLLQSRGFGNDNKEIAWEEVTCLPSLSECLLSPPFLCPIQL